VRWRKGREFLGETWDDDADLSAGLDVAGVVTEVEIVGAEVVVGVEADEGAIRPFPLG